MNFITKRNTIVIAGIFAAIVFLLFYSNRIFVTPDQGAVTTIDDGLTLISDEHVYTDVSFSNLHNYIEATDSITLQFELGNMDDISDLALGFRSNHEVVDVSINGDNVYSFGQDYYDEHQFIPSMYNFIDLSNASAGDEISITLMVDHGKPAAPDKLSIGSIYDITQNFVQSRRSAMFVGLFLCMFGMLIIALVPVMLVFKEKDISLVCCGMFAIVLGSYILSYSDALLFFMPNMLEASLTEYVAFYIGPVVLNFVMLSLVGKYWTLKRGNIILVSIDAVMFVCACILQALKVKLFYEVTVWFQVVILLECIYAVYEIYALIRNKKREDERYIGFASTLTRAIGVVVFVVMMFVDVVSALATYFLFETSISERRQYFTLAGSVLFIICVMLSYVFSAIDHRNAKKTKKNLEELAYTDKLTLVANRAKCSLVMGELDETPDAEYTVIAIDMDNLKSMNDAFGHEYGDNKIRKLAEMLLKSFGDEAELVGRMGGDEFIIILKGTDRSRCNNLLVDLLSRLGKYNGMETTRIPLQISYGCACSDEYDFMHCYEVYNWADERMYRMKEQHHLAARRENADEK